MEEKREADARGGGEGKGPCQIIPDQHRRVVFRAVKMSRRNFPFVYTTTTGPGASLKNSREIILTARGGGRGREGGGVYAFLGVVQRSE